MRQVFGMAADGQSIMLNRFNADSFFQELEAKRDSAKNEQSQQAVSTAILLDVETTGTNKQKDKIIDLGYLVFSYAKQTGELLAIQKEFSQLEDPEEELSEEIIKLTGYTNADLAGKSIDWQEVRQDFENAQVIVAHNAYFDRAFLDRYLDLSKDKIWTCSMSQIPWRQKGHGSRSLEFLLKDHGLFFDGHTALADVKATLRLLSFTDPETHYSYFKELLDEARIPMKWVFAKNASFDFKDQLKDRGYMWDATLRSWKKKCPQDTDSEETFISNNSPAAGHAVVEAIKFSDHFKS